MRVPYCHSERMRGIFPQAFSLSVGERKIMNHFVVNVSFDLAGGLARYDLRPVPVRERTLQTAKATTV
jgi:hypothetical protein